MKIAIVATSSVVPRIEFREGFVKLGSEVVVAANVEQEHFLFAGDDETRAAKFAEAANSDADVIWCATGGYGAARMLPLLDRQPTPAAKTLVGYSDVTALLSYVRTRWNWRTIHAPMVASGEVKDTLAWLRQPVAKTFNLKWLTPPASVSGPLIGGNLAVWTSLAGTPYIESAAGKMVFLEDIEEPPYRIDRMVNQLLQAGALADAAAIVLGQFTGCEDRVKRVRGDQPLRRTWGIDEALVEIFARVHVPVAAGLPAGHGKGAVAIQLGVAATLASNGELTISAV